jgi:hypothetical protein
MNLVGKQDEKPKNGELIALQVLVNRVRAATVGSDLTIWSKTPEQVWRSGWQYRKA